MSYMSKQKQAFQVKQCKKKYQMQCWHRLTKTLFLSKCMHQYKLTGEIVLLETAKLKRRLPQLTSYTSWRKFSTHLARLQDSTDLMFHPVKQWATAKPSSPRVSQIVPEDTDNQTEQTNGTAKDFHNKNFDKQRRVCSISQSCSRANYSNSYATKEVHQTNSQARSKHDISSHPVLVVDTFLCRYLIKTELFQHSRQYNGIPAPSASIVEEILGKDLYYEEVSEDQDEITHRYSMKVVAHRGAGLDAPENSISALKLSALVSFLRTCTGRATHPLYCLDRSTVHVLEAVRDELTSIHSAKENSCLYWLA
uniref:Uncharacterized protein n=1 Tax=Timema tahoe TaxID=61484 RepID=A0A7R9ID46_9NEOP|nr:unnamed protein product [Timema tahoe]